MTAKEFLETDRSGKIESAYMGDCGVCTKPITDEHPDEVRMVEGKPVHEDCYFDKLGNLVEEHPITFPRLEQNGGNT